MAPPEDKHLELELLREELRLLARRVDALEHPGERVHGTAAGPVPTVPDFAFPGAIPVAGRAILGLAGAYLLRALVESDSAPRLLVVVVAVLYAAAWLVLSVRRHAAFSVTASLILAPMLWEATVRFNVFAPWAAAGILVAYLSLGSALSWAAVPEGIATIPALVVAVALMVHTGDLVPFATALVAIAAIVEARSQERNIRVPVALAADFAVWLLVYIMARPGGIPPDYRPASPAVCVALCGALLMVYAASVAWRTVFARRAVSVFEICQTMAAFGLAAWGAIQLTRGEAAAPLGALCAVAAAACYFTAFIRFADVSADARRNHHVFASWGLGLGLLACFLILPAEILVAVWSAAAVVATLVPGLALHGTLYLVAAGLISGLPAAVLNAFTGVALERPTPGLWIVAVAAICCYAARASLVPALIGGVSLGSLVLLMALPALGNPGPSVSATARTLVTCSLALAFAFAGSRTGRRELVWIGYAAIGLGSVKLLLQDFRQSTPAALAVSLVCYGALLILAPRMRGKPAPPESGPPKV